MACRFTSLLNPLGFREPHRHPNADALTYYVRGEALVTIFSNGSFHDTFERFGSKKFADLVEPAAAYAEEGFLLGQKGLPCVGVGRFQIAYVRPFGSGISAQVDQLLSDAFIASRRSVIRMDRAIPTATAGRLPRDTTYFTVVDKDRNAVSFITSISDVFGSGMVAGDTGIILHNRAAEFSLEPGHPNEIRPGSGRVTASSHPWCFGAMICT